MLQLEQEDLGQIVVVSLHNQLEMSTHDQQEIFCENDTMITFAICTNVDV